MNGEAETEREGDNQMTPDYTQVPQDIVVFVRRTTLAFLAVAGVNFVKSASPCLPQPVNARMRSSFPPRGLDCEYTDGSVYGVAFVRVIKLA